VRTFLGRCGREDCVNRDKKDSIQRFITEDNINPDDEDFMCKYCARSMKVRELKEGKTIQV